MAQGSIGKIIDGEYVPFATNGGGSVASHDATKVDKTDISSIILAGSINNTGETITAGTWFYLNGTPCVAKVDIASGATFTESTNYEEKTVGSALSELNSNNSFCVTDDVKCIRFSERLGDGTGITAGQTYTFDLTSWLASVGGVVAIAFIRGSIGGSSSVDTTGTCYVTGQTTLKYTAGASQSAGDKKVGISGMMFYFTN